jgi:hypothetical protein
MTPASERSAVAASSNKAPQGTTTTPTEPPARVGVAGRRDYPAPARREAVATPPAKSASAIEPAKAQAATSPARTAGPTKARPRGFEAAKAELGAVEAAKAELGAVEAAKTGLGAVEAAKTALGASVAAGTAPGTRETAETRLGARETAALSPGARETTAPSSGARETAAPSPGARETAETGSGAREVVKTGPASGSGGNRTQQPGSVAHQVPPKAERHIAGQRVDGDRAAPSTDGRPNAESATRTAKPKPARAEGRPVPGARLSNYVEEAAELLAGPANRKRRRTVTGLTAGDPATDERPIAAPRLPRKGRANPAAD